MKKIFILFLVIFSFSFNTLSEEVVFELNFDNSNSGKYLKENLINDGGEMRWALFKDRASIIADPKGKKGNVLKVEYPKGSVGPQTNGVQFIKDLPPSNEYYLDYYVLFEDGFDFRQGGKLPGLTSGGSKFTGGTHPNNGEGWSARYMWVKKGEAIVYFYYVDMISKYGDAVRTNINFETEKWYRLTQRIKLNENNLSNGVMQVWIDGNVVIHHTNVRFRLWEKGLIDSFYFSTFHGGASQDWAPQNDSSALYDNIRVTIKKPVF